MNTWLGFKIAFTTVFISPCYKLVVGAFVPQVNSIAHKHRFGIVTSLPSFPANFMIDEDKLAFSKPKHEFVLRMKNTQSDSDEVKTRAQIRAENIESRDLSEGFNSILLPIAEQLDGLTGGWALSYADLSPENENTLAGKMFLATNLGYALLGIYLAYKGDFLFGGLTELAGIVSYWYHYSQLRYPGDKPEVRLALLIDYFTAGASLITATAYLVQAGIALESIPTNIIVAAGSAIFSLGLGWIWEYGLPYLITHSLWHILGAYTGFLVGQLHLDQMTSLQVSSLTSANEWIHFM